MASNQNSASRLYELFSQAASQSGNQPTAKAWSKVFGVEFEDTPAGYGRIARLLALVSEELESAHREMRATQYSADTYNPVFNRLRVGIGLEELKALWKGPQRRFKQGDTLRMLKLFSEILPDEGRAVTSQAIEQLENLLEELENLVSEEDMPEELCSFLLQQIEIIRQALQAYPILGEKAFEKAVGDALMRVPEYQEIVKEYGTHEAIGTLEKVWARILTWSTRVSALRELFSAGEGLAGFITSGEPT